MSTSADPVILTPLGGPTVLVEVGGVRFLADPTFDVAGEYPIGSRVLVKTTDAVWTPEQVGQVDAVLLSHDQHPDNLDHGGRAYLASESPLTLTTPVAAEHLGGTAAGLRPWEARQVGDVTVTAVPAQHGPDGTEHLTGPVTGFVLAAPGGPHLYVSGDNASLRLVAEVADRFGHIDLAVLFAGAARTPLVDGYLTLTSEEAVEAARILGTPPVLPVHTDGWEHFTQDGASLRAAFSAAGLDSLLLPVTLGQAISLA
ncbi:MAG TPA: MBL fold metallo-hydrolase [Trebonia sp.]|nr:MBL fold metallo-hydrolase [Trebonia sp.]